MKRKKMAMVLACVLGLAGCTTVQKPPEPSTAEAVAWLNVGMDGSAITALLGEPAHKSETEWSYTRPYAQRQVALTATMRTEYGIPMLEKIFVSYEGKASDCSALFDRMEQDWMGDLAEEDKERQESRGKIKIVHTKEQTPARQIGLRYEGDQSSVAYERTFAVETDFNPYYASCLLYRAAKDTLTQPQVDALMGQGAGQSQEISAEPGVPPQQAWVYDDVRYLGRPMRMALFYTRKKGNDVLQRIVLFYDGDAVQTTALYNDAVALWEKEKETMDFRQTLLDGDMVREGDVAQGQVLAEGELGEHFQSAKTTWSNNSKSGDASRLARRSITASGNESEFTTALSIKPFIASQYW